MTTAEQTVDVQTHLGWWVDAWRPSTNEDSYEITDVEGQVPREIYGTLYRNGPSQKILPPGGDGALHLFDGDALVHAFRFEDGRVHYTDRFVRNASFLAEQAEGRFNQNSVGVTVDNPTDAVLMRQQHNTNVVHHGGKLMAMVENAYPFEIDARTLDPIGEHTFGGRMLGMSTTAHPKIDGRTGQMVIHGYQFMPPFVQLYVIEPDGTCSLAEAVDVPYPTMMHDIAITEHYAIILLTPIVVEPIMGAAGPEGGFSDWVKWRPERGLKFGVRKREAGATVQWFDAPTPAFMFHPGNAYEADGKIYMDACSYLDGGALLKSLETIRAGEVVPGSGANPFLYELDLATGRCSERQLSERTAEFPRLDDRLVGYPNQYGYAVIADGQFFAGGRHQIVKYDRQGGPNVVHDFGLGHFPGEPIFVPRAADAAEDEGYILTVVHDSPNGSSYLAILEAQNLDAAPVAKLTVRHRIPAGFHGNFAPGIV